MLQGLQSCRGTFARVLEVGFIGGGNEPPSTIFAVVAH